MLSRKLAALALIPAAVLVAVSVAVPAQAGPAAAAQGNAAQGNSAHGNSAQGNSAKVWVCKYVHAPGAETEVLKPGKQPIAVHGSATAGELFNDAHGRSLVIDAVTAQNTSHPGNSYTGEFVCPPSPDGAGEEPGEEPGDPDDGINLN